MTKVADRIMPDGGYCRGSRGQVTPIMTQELAGVDGKRARWS